MIRILACFVCLCAALIPASAQDWAKAHLEKSPRHQEWVTVKNGDRAVQCFVVYPEVKNKATAVLLVHEIFGLSDWVRSLADELAEAGYIAIAPDLLSGLGPNGGGTSALGQDGAVRSISSLPPEQITGDLNAVAGYVTKLPSCNGKLVVAGFCWGGGQAFRYATNNPALRAAFVFYGMGPDSEEAIARIHCPVYGFYAGNDARISTTVPDTTKQMKQDHKKYVPVIYDGAGHGFMRAGEAPDATPGNKKARDEAWARWTALLKQI